MAGILDAGVTGSKHDLSTAGVPGDNQVCIWCHTPHHANNTFGVAAPLWNRYVDVTSKSYQVYSSPTMDTVPGNPQTTVSILCLGCHDGTVGSAVVRGNLGDEKHELITWNGQLPDRGSWPNCRRCHGEMYGDPPAVWQGTDLRDDHPIAMRYPTKAQDPKFNIPPDLENGWSTVKLYSGRVECPSCHNVHEPANPPFLRISNVGSQLCIVCHIK